MIYTCDTKCCHFIFFGSAETRVCPDCGKRIELFGKSRIAQEAAELHLPVLAQLPFNSKAAQLCDEGNIEAVENPLMADAASAVAGEVQL